MLDVHAPHETAHTWKDFFVHLATIVIGLLIAVGLEQLVERLHDGHKLHATQEDLRREREANGKDLITNSHNWRWEMAELQNNLMVLEYIAHHPGEPQTTLPGDLRWVQLPIFSNHAVWDASQQNGLIRLMSPVEANSNQTFYQWLSTLTDQSNSTWNAINDARRFALQDPDPTHLSGQQLYETIQLTETAIEKHLQVGYSIALINSMFPGLPSTLSYDEIRTHLSSPYQQDPQGMAAAHQRTMDRLKAAGYVPQDDELAFPKSGGR
jgi:biotin operon repressor